MAEMWFDGHCKECGCIVIETSSNDLTHDYMNSCMNPNCKNYGWHYNYDCHFQSYYDHKRNEIEIPANGDNGGDNDIKSSS